MVGTGRHWRRLWCRRHRPRRNGQDGLAAVGTQHSSTPRPRELCRFQPVCRLAVSIGATLSAALQEPLLAKDRGAAACIDSVARGGLEAPDIVMGIDRVMSVQNLIDCYPKLKGPIQSFLVSLDHLGSNKIWYFADATLRRANGIGHWDLGGVLWQAVHILACPHCK
jgi:hypothetical protein